MDPYCVENKHRIGDLKKKLESLLLGGSESEKHGVLLPPPLSFMTRQSEVSYLRAFVLHRAGRQDSACAHQQSYVRVRGGGGVMLANNHVNKEINEVFGP